ncbi:phosphoglycerate mutase-like protein [Neolentinus lepideus HHB14362 ss-1]|uniref:Phosphoglycerate mutase-like protein n=1 Tax=Neolentinus lepideus HHB14362 ss-1 TaxID=1314782 RepID=A0A165NME2_9AGAM|nr:phosphoglycerate mutase-like protein [Neolentinus lepideus HHB14362 ss-1]
MLNLALLALVHLASATNPISTPNGVYNSSTTPSSFPWNTYNYCNAPHVNAEHYNRPSVEGAELVYMNVMFRHHKRTPDNLYPNENGLNPAAGWNCSNFIQFNYGGGTAHVNHQVVIPPSHPFLTQIWNGTCDQGTLTQEGLEDAIKHGRDFWSVYHDTVGFLPTVNPKDLYIRTSVSDRTYQVAGGLLYGMNPAYAGEAFTVYTQPTNIDSLVPDYDCPLADNLRNAYQSVPAWTDHLNANAALQARLGETTGTSNLSAWTSWYDHYFDTFTSRTCAGHPLPCNATTGACVSEQDAATVFAIGDFEYNYIWHSAQNASNYTALTFGVMFSELAVNFKSFQAGSERYKARLYVGHDGSMIRLASGLGLGKIATLRWPALGSEMAMEVWKANGKNFVRVMHEGTPVQTLSWVPLTDFISLLESQVPPDLYNTCMDV